MRIFFSVIIFCLLASPAFCQPAKPKEYSLSVSLNNAPFGSLALLDYSTGRNVIIRGIPAGKYRWEFKIPDSIVENSENMMLIVPDKDTSANAYHQVKFIREDTKTSLVNIGIQGRKNYIEANYMTQNLFREENVASFLGLVDSLVLGNLISNDFSLSVKKDSSDITIRSADPFYSWFYSDSQKKITYNDYLSSYITLAKTYPDSRYLIGSLARNLNQYKTRADVDSIYRNFSKKLKSSVWGKRIALFLSDEIQSMTLLNLQSGKSEKLIRDQKKYNLLIFSASWCIPCIEEIPVLKKLYGLVSQKVEFTSVSLDREKDIKAFEKILLGNKVPWRSLYAHKSLARVRDFFGITSIPYTLLFYPDGRVEAMDVRNTEMQKKLLSLK